MSITQKHPQIWWELLKRVSAFRYGLHTFLEKRVKRRHTCPTSISGDRSRRHPAKGHHYREKDVYHSLQNHVHCIWGWLHISSRSQESVEYKPLAASLDVTEILTRSDTDRTDISVGAHCRGYIQIELMCHHVNFQGFFSQVATTEEGNMTGGTLSTIGNLKAAVGERRT
ncbi:uncharacterized protein BT62DRAFT_993801 [Guyanagaster necrorhizus]|uniref:Uncharacterized protein n=1 Tax=Guyanagaster necrorhizus TaxID=856835 RepID=A0A9P7VVI6_9AGAR|nr:uncharacterized protein BT62DRAFT_993801 [Guyanagaster necrorhizus MCA 3950]KAG7446939.1 hypothetical protein BT62DRAFT_993801 [Guyanagaster necrorhizus MCA 3950]